MASSESVDAPHSWCRVCLAVDVRMHWIRNTRLLEIYEKLSGTRLNAEDGRPNTICYICYSQLQRCCRFSDMCHKSEQLQRELLQSGTEAQGAVPPTAITHNLEVTALSIIDYSNQGNTDVKVKEELLIEEIEIEAKEEPIDIEESTYAEDVMVDDNLMSSERARALYFCCDVCNKQFVFKKNLVDHMGIHFSKEQNACAISSKSFTDGSNFIRHKRIHTGENPYACDICNKSFSNGSNLIRHKRIHTGENPYACNICNKSFTDRSDLSRHMRIHTGEKPYACNMCNKSFAQASNLITHKRIHTGEKPYACNICNKSFAAGSDLNRHKRIHTREKPYVCNICNKSFAAGSDLSRHKRIHPGEKPYVCDMYINKT